MKKRVLLIEDNLEMRENTTEILELADYEVFTAVNGKAGVEMAEEVIPDLIISDISMPGLDGFDVLSALSNNPYTADIPFIFLTARTEKEDKFRGIGLGADDYVTKPYDAEMLLNTIEVKIRKNEKVKKELEQERLRYIGVLEEMLYITSHRVRKPICSCLGLLQLMHADSKHKLTEEDTDQILSYVRMSVGELDDFTKELTLFLHEAGQRTWGNKRV